MFSFFTKKKVEKSEEWLFPIPVPSLVAVLINKENEKGSPLTEVEVIDIRDNAASIMMPVDAVEKVNESRGYVDIDPENAWEAWQKYKAETNENS